MCDQSGISKDYAKAQEDKNQRRPRSHAESAIKHPAGSAQKQVGSVVTELIRARAVVASLEEEHDRSDTHVLDEIYKDRLYTQVQMTSPILPSMFSCTSFQGSLLAGHV